MAQKPVRVDPALLINVRQILIDKLEARLAPITVNGFIRGFEDEAFVKQFGPGLHKVPDSLLVDLALAELGQLISRAPEGKSGLSFFDE